MRELSSGWSTDLAILRYSGADIADRTDHLIIRSPMNPNFHWGNCLFVLDERKVDEASRWVSTFHAAFPSAAWVAIGLVRMPDDTDAWTKQDVGLELDDVLTMGVAPHQRPLAAGYDVHELVDDIDWERVVQRNIAENERSGEYEPTSHATFVRDLMQTRRGLTQRGLAAFFGAFADETLVSELGIVKCGQTARYQAVVTEPEHRARGLASHLLGVAAQWAAQRGCTKWVIITEATNPAGRVYRRAGFEPDVGNAQAYRRPPH